MRMLRLTQIAGAGLLMILGVGAGPARADVEVVIGYETRCVGEIEQCG